MLLTKSLVGAVLLLTIHVQHALLFGDAELALDALDVTKERVHDIVEKIPAIHHD